MRKVLAIIAAIMLAAVVLSPAMGYTISSGANESYSIKSTFVNYSISMGSPAHNISPGMIPAAVTPTSAVTVIHTPYSIKLGAAVPYSIKLASGVSTTPTGVSTPHTILLGSLAKNAAAAATTIQEAPATQTPAPAEVPAANATQNVSAPAPQPAPAAEPVANTTQNVTTSAPAPTKFAIMGIVLNETSNLGLADWKVNLEQPAGTVVANATTNSTGNYAFNDLNSGEYVVAEVVPADWAPVTPADGKQNVNLIDKDITGINFANKMNLPVNATPAINATAPVGPS